MQKTFNLSGLKVSMLEVITRVPSRKGRSHWYCLCDCGNHTTVSTHYLRKESSKSCGCLMREKVGGRYRDHGLSRTRLYKTWNNMRNRCQNKERPDYCYYGGKGINVCSEWDQSFPTFREWALSSGYHKDLTIDRIDIEKGYSPSNCRWEDRAMQARNRSATIIDEDQASLIKTMLNYGVGASEIGRIFGISRMIPQGIKNQKGWRDVPPMPV